MAQLISAGPATEPSYYLVQAGDSLYGIAQILGVDAAELLAANNMTTPDTLEAGHLLRVPGPDGAVPPWAVPVVTDDAPPAVVLRKGVAERLTPFARAARPDSPFYKRTWLTYYGRPNIPVMGILGEHDVVTLTQILKEKAAEYDRVNGPTLTVQPAIHLVHGMATVAPNEDGSHLAYLTDAELLPYIEHALREDVAVILDVQVANLTPAAAISRTLEYLKYPNVHLAMDPEFAMSYPGQRVPGNPIGYVTAEQVNEAQRVIADYMRAQGIAGKRLLLVHQFQSDMIVGKEKLDPTFPEVELVLSVDGFGVPYVKIWKYNALVDESSPFTSFKIFYRWDEPVMTPAQALGIDASEQTDFIEITPNMIQYQ
jgi:LysM repeat protein